MFPLSLGLGTDYSNPMLLRSAYQQWYYVSALCERLGRLLFTPSCPTHQTHPLTGIVRTYQQRSTTAHLKRPPRVRNENIGANLHSLHVEYKSAERGSRTQNWHWIQYSKSCRMRYCNFTNMNMH